MFRPNKRTCCLYALFFFLVFLNFSSCIGRSENSNKISLNPVGFSIDIYQKYISPVDGSRCQMSPSCSSYSRQAFKRHGILTGWIMTCDRLLRCGRDETSLTPATYKNNNKYCNDSLDNNDFWWYSGDEN